MLIPSSAALD